MRSRRTARAPGPNRPARRRRSQPPAQADERRRGPAVQRPRAVAPWTPSRYPCLLMGGMGSERLTSILLRALAAGLALGCGARTGLPSPTADCPADAPTCVVDGVRCDPATVVSAVCDARTHAWSCSAGARVYARAA